MRRIAPSSSSQTAGRSATVHDARPRHPSRHENRRIPKTIHTTPRTSKPCTNWSFFPLILSHLVCIKNGLHIRREQQQSGLSQASASNREVLSLRHHLKQVSTLRPGGPDTSLPEHLCLRSKATRAHASQTRSVQDFDENAA